MQLLVAVMCAAGFLLQGCQQGCCQQLIADTFADVPPEGRKSSLPSTELQAPPLFNSPEARRLLLPESGSPDMWKNGANPSDVGRVKGETDTFKRQKRTFHKGHGGGGGGFSLFISKGFGGGGGGGGGGCGGGCGGGYPQYQQQPVYQPVYQQPAPVYHPQPVYQPVYQQPQQIYQSGCPGGCGPPPQQVAQCDVCGQNHGGGGGGSWSQASSSSSASSGSWGKRK